MGVRLPQPPLITKSADYQHFFCAITPRGLRQTIAQPSMPKLKQGMDKKNLHYPEVHYSFDASDVTKRWYLYWYDDTGTRQRQFVSQKLWQVIDRHEQAKQLLAIINPLQNFADFFPKVAVNYYDDLAGRFIAKKVDIDRIEPKTVLEYKSVMKYFFAYINEVAGGKPLAQLPTDLPLNFIHSLYRKGYHMRTINRYHTTIGQVYMFEGLDHPLRTRKLTKPISTSYMYFQRSQVLRLKKHFLEHDAQMWLFCQCMYYLLMRPNEVRLMQVAHILLDDDKVIVPESNAKTNRQRFVLIPDAFKQVIVDSGIMSYPLSHYVFSALGHPSEKPASRNVFSRQHQKVVKLLAMDWRIYKLFSWRHTGVVWAWKAGIDLVQLQMQLGHTEITTTMEYLKNLGLHDLAKLKANFPAI